MFYVSIYKKKNPKFNINKMINGPLDLKKDKW